VTGERFRVLGLAGARAGWFREVSRWSTAAAVPVEFIKCVALEELLARLRSGRAFSALLVDAGVAGLDRDLVDQAREVGAAVVIVDDGHTRRDWLALGADAVLPPTFDRAVLLSTLLQAAQPVQRPDASAAVEPLAVPGWRGRLVAVTGPAGGGSSTVAMAAAQGLASRGGLSGASPSGGDDVLLADCALHADQALLHDAGDIVPGLQEVVEAHRSGLPEAGELRGLTFVSEARGYHLLLGLRRHRDWTALRPRAVQASIDGLLRAFDVVVADVDADLEGDDEVGSIDVEDRNLLARSVIARAELVMVVAVPTIAGLRRLATTVDDLLRFGVGPDRLQPILTRAPRRARSRAELTAAVAELTSGLGHGADELASPAFLPERANLEHLHRVGSPLPRSLVDPVAGAVIARLNARPLVAEALDAFAPVAVRPGSLGAWADEEEVAG